MPHKTLEARREHYRTKIAAQRKANPRMNKKYSLKANYGLTLEEYDTMYAGQNRACSICARPLIAYPNRSQHNERACVDHCHTTGRVRGILCNECNTGLGNFKDSPMLMRRAIEYLQGE